MSYEQGRLTKNTTYYTTALVIQKILSFFYFVLIARMIGVTDAGKYIFALSFTTIFSVFVDFGLTPILIREIAKDKGKTHRYLSNIVSLKIILGLVVWAIVILLVNLLGYPPITKTLVYLAGLVMVLDSLSLSFYGVLRGYQNLKYESIGTIIYEVIVVTLGIVALVLKAPLVILILVFVVASSFNFCYSLILLYRKKLARIKFSLDRHILKALLIIALPFAIAGIFNRVYSYIDTILLSILAGDKFVGWYGVAYKLTFALQFIPAAFAASLYPAFSGYFVTSREHLVKTFERAFNYLMIVAIPIACGTIILADKIILKLYGLEYSPSILPLQILMGSLIFIFLNYPVGSLLNACNRQIINTINMGIAMVINVLLNILLIPYFTFIGASIASLSSATILFFLGFIWTNRIIKFNKFLMFKNFLKPLFAGLAMGSTILYLKPQISFLILIPLGVFIYFIILYLLRGFTKEDIKVFYKSIFVSTRTKNKANS